MAGALLSILIEAYNKSLGFADNVMSKFDDEKYARAVTEMYGRTPTYEEYDTAIELIKQDDSISTKEKIDLLAKVRNLREESIDKDVERKKKAAETVDEGNRKKGDVAVKIAMGVMTGGVSLLPDAVNSVRGLGKNKKKKRLGGKDESEI